MSFLKNIGTVIFLSLAVFDASSQESAQTLILRGVNLYQNGYWAEAFRVLKEANKSDPDNRKVLLLLGQIEIAREKWADARGWFEKALKIDPANLQALYNSGICYRETGKYKAFLLRRRDWKKSESFFQSVIARDSTFQDVLYQYSMLQRYRKDFYQAISLVEHQLDLNPGNVPAAVARYEYYDALLFHDDEQEIKQWLSKQSTSMSRFYFAELMRRDDHLNLADSIMTVLIHNADSTMCPIPVLLSLARLGAQQNNAEKIQRCYQQAVESVRSLIDAALVFEDVKYILSDEELRDWENRGDVPGKIEFLKMIWLLRNPMPAADINFRLEAHYKRMVQAEEFFRYDGFRTWMNNPDKVHYLNFPRIFTLNSKFNDKGVVYIRHGEPDDRAFDVGPNIPQNESWLYYKSANIDHNLIFHFIIDEYAAGNNWRLTAVLPQNLVESRLGWDPIFNRIYNANPLEMLELDLQMAQKSRDDVMLGLNSDRHSWAEEVTPIYFPFYIATFRGKGQDTRYEIYYSLKDTDIWPGKKSFSPDSKVEIGFSAYDMDMNEVEVMRRTVTGKKLRNSSDSLGLWPDQFEFESHPQRYNFSLYASVQNENKLGGFKFKYGLADYRDSTLCMSGIELASRIVSENHSGRFYKNGLEVVPNPPRSYRKKDPVYVYFEIYNLPIGNRSMITFNIQYNFTLIKQYRKNIFKKMAHVFSSDKPQTSQTMERFSQSSVSVEYLALDMSHYDSGYYECEITVDIPSRHLTTSRKTEFELK